MNMLQAKNRHSKDGRTDVSTGGWWKETAGGTGDNSVDMFTPPCEKQLVRTCCSRTGARLMPQDDLEEWDDGG